MPETTTLPVRPRAASSAVSPARSAASPGADDPPRATSTPMIPEDAIPISPPPAQPRHAANLEPPAQPVPQRPAGLTKRLTRMFSQGNSKTNTPEKSPDPPKDRVPIERALHKDGNASDSSTNGQSTEPASSKPPSRTPSYKGSDAGRKASVAPAQKPSHGAEKSTRFVVSSDGSHEHHLKSAKRQEKLSGLLREMLGGKKREADNGDDQQLTLMSTWVDQLKSERDKLAMEKKGGPNSSETLVSKYGKCHEVIGRGAFGIVRVAHRPDPNDSKKEQLYAVKEFRKRPQESAKKYQKRLTSEFCISSSLRHPNIIHTLDLLQDDKGDFVAVMALASGGDLYTLVLAAGRLEVAEADCYWLQLLRGLEYMHEMGVSHRDLKPENLLLTTRGSLKISDFGNAECFRMAWESEPHMTAGLCGSAPYIAPEEYTDKEFDPRAVDVWATGVIYMAMRTGRHLWRVARKDDDNFYQQYLEGRRDENGYQPIETLHRARCRNVIYSILDPNPSRRITASQVLKSEWCREIKVCKAGEEGF